ncbi:MAG: branched-chain amino acid ABC transporter substrate-binding protein [Propionibacteriaceae bacterium]|nr:branched-chain amino acid ABC transporter substrate-binding protein [Propionibacteriaceae bacterium]
MLVTTELNPRQQFVKTQPGGNVRKHRLVIAGATLLAATLAMSACGTRSETPGGTTGNETKTAKIGVIAPLSGDLSALGLGIKNSVDLAIKQANESKAIPGWTLELSAQDDQATPDVGKNAATKLAGDPDVVGVVGTLNSSVSQSVQPVLSSAGIPQVSPANTGTALTQGKDFATAPKRPYPGYFRTCTTDAVQGPFAAKYLYGTGIKKVATIHDKKAYGQGLVAAFTKEFTDAGGQIAAAETVNPDDKDFGTVITKVKNASPEAVYYGGEYPQAGPMSQQMKAAGLNVPLMGGDGIYDPAFIELAGKTAEGDLATSVGAPPEKLPSAKAFIDAYKSAGYKEPYAAYGPYSYDAANTIINALKVSLKDASDVKSALPKTIEEMGKVSFEGATGPVAFDEFGDTTTKVLTVYKVTGGKWVADKTGS